MADMKYTESEFEKAAEFLRRRIESEASIRRDVEELLLSYAEALLMLMFRNTSSEEINALVDELIAQITDDTYILGVDEHESKRAAIMLYMNSIRGGDTMEGRIKSRVNTFLIELGALYLASKLLSIAQEKVYASIKENMKKPWDNPIIAEARQKITKGELPGNVLQFSEPHFGRGVEVSSLGALQKITAYHVADAWMWWRHEEALEEGAKGYYVIRNSDYPCDICQGEADAGFHPMSDKEHIVPLHMNCVCSIVYSYVDRL